LNPLWRRTWTYTDRLPAVKAFVTGGTGFIGGRIVSQLRERGDEVVALVRSRSKASDLEELGCEIVEGDLSDRTHLARHMKGCDSAFHVAAMYKVGIPTSMCPKMREANVTGTERTLDAAVEAGVERIVYVSTIGYFGNTKGKVVDETYRRAPTDFVSCYDETKYWAHEAARERIEAGAPIIIVQPGGVFGPGDTSDVATFMRQVIDGKLKFLTFPEAGFNLAHVDDIAAGIILAHDKGKLGDSYVLGGEITTLGKTIKRAAVIAGKKPPRFTMPAFMVKASIPLSPLVTKMMGLPPNLRELIRASNGVTYWASDAKARRELGYSPRGLDTGLKETVASFT
jgi:dihydroflavonol-4-reductase